MKHVTPLPTQKEYNTQMPKKFIHQLLLAGLLVSASGISVSQVYLPSADVGRDSPEDFDPDILRTFTDDSGGSRTRRNAHCGGNTPVPGACNGIIHHRLGNPRVVPPESQGSSPTLMFDYQVRVGQDATPAYPNYLQALGIYFIYGSEAFGQDWFINGHCTGENNPLFVTPTGVAATVGNPGGADFQGGAQFINDALGRLGPTPPDQPNPSYVFPYDSRGQVYTTVVTINCRIRGSSAPANIAVQGRTLGGNQQVLLDKRQIRYVPVVEKNLWYYPLDGSPAIVDVEASGGGGHFYIDVTFNKGVAKRDGTAVGMGEFAGAVTLIPRTTAYGDERSTHTLTLASVTKPGGALVEAGDKVIRLQFDGDPATTATLVTGDPNVLISVEPPDDMIYAWNKDTRTVDTTAELHRGEEWWVRAWYDHRAPYIKTAEVGGGNTYVDVAFSQPVKFDFSFDANTQADMRSTAGPVTEDFVIIYYDDAGMGTNHPPARIEMYDASGNNRLSEMPATGVTRLRVILPPDIPTDGSGALDIRTAQRQKNPAHPSLASVFIYGAANLGRPPTSTEVENGMTTEFAEYRKNGKFAKVVGNTNFPRTAAFAQVGSLPLKRAFEVTFDPNVPPQNLVIGGAAVDIEVGLFDEDGAPDLEKARLLDDNEIVTVNVAWQAPGPTDVELNGQSGPQTEISIELSNSTPVGSFTAEAGATTGTWTLKIDEVAYVGGAAADVDVTIGARNTLDVSVIREVQLDLVFVDPEGVTPEGVGVTSARIGGETEVEVNLSGDAALNALSGESVSVMFSIIEQPAGSGVTVSPPSLTFPIDSEGRVNAQRVTIAAASNAVTRLLADDRWVSLSATVSVEQQTVLGGIRPVPVRFESSFILVEVLPDFAFADNKRNAEAFAALITDSAPGAKLLLGSGANLTVVDSDPPITDDDVLIVPGTGGRMELDLYDPVMTKTSDVHVCVWRGEDQLPISVDSNDCRKAEHFTLLAESNTTARTAGGMIVEAVRTAEVGNWTNIVYWAAIDVSATLPIRLLGYQVVYVAPPVGFRTSLLAYSSPVSSEVDVGLASALDATLDVGVTIVVEEVIEGDIIDRSTLPETMVALSSGSTNTYATAPSPKALEIVALNGVTFDADDFDLGLSPGGDPGTVLERLIKDRELLSIGNARLELRLSNLSPGLFSRPSNVSPDMFAELDTFRVVGAVSGAGSFDVALPSGESLEEVSVTVYEFRNTPSLTFDKKPSTSLALVPVPGSNPFVQWGDDFAAELDGLPANSFIEIEAAGSVFRMLVTERGYTAPVDKTPVPGAYAQAEVEALGNDVDDLSLQADWGIEPRGGNTGVFDYLIANLDPGEVVSVVLPLKAAVSGDEAGFLVHKYTDEAGWQPFAEMDFDEVYSAPAPCPSEVAPRGEADDSSAAWRSASGGVREGDGCILLQIQDGGANDADMTADGVLHDPEELREADVGRGRGGGGAMEPAWLILLAGGMLLSAGLRRRRRPAPSA